jgi:hypothetical protein
MFLAKAQRARQEREERTRCLKGLAQVWDWPWLVSGIGRMFEASSAAGGRICDGPHQTPFVAMKRSLADPTFLAENRFRRVAEPRVLGPVVPDFDFR